MTDYSAPRTSVLPQELLEPGIKLNHRGTSTTIAKALLALSIVLGNAQAQNQPGSIQVAAVTPKSVPGSPEKPLVTNASNEKPLVAIASNGDSFEDFITQHGDGALDEAIRKRDSGEWTGKDNRDFVKYQNRRNKEILAGNLRQRTENAATISRIQSGIACDNQQITIEGNRLLGNYILLRANKEKPGFDHTVYEGVRATLRQLLLRGEPEDLIAKLKPYEKELLSS